MAAHLVESEVKRKRPPPHTHTRFFLPVNQIFGRS